MMCGTEAENSNRCWGWPILILLNAGLLLFAIFNSLQTCHFAEVLTKSDGASPSPPSLAVASQQHNHKSITSKPLLNPSSSPSCNREIEIKTLLSHVLVTISYWYDPREQEAKFLGHTLGTIREWRLLPEVGNVTVVIITNNATAAKGSISRTNGDWYAFHQVDTNEQPFHMPFYHREIVADYLDREKDGTNMTVMLNKDLPPPTAYSFFEADNVLDGAGLLAWAQDTALLLDIEGEEPEHVRHFWRWEWSDKKGCAAFTGQVKPIERNDSSRLLSIGGKDFVSMTGGVWAGMYVLTAQHMLKYYNSGAFWNLPKKYKYAREIQLHDVIHGDDVLGMPEKASKDTGIHGDNTIVPIDENTGTVHLIAGVHHQSDKYAKKKMRFSKLCIYDLFI